MRMYGFRRYGDQSVQEFMDAAVSPAAEGTVLIRTQAVSINPADIKVRNGQRQGKVEVTFPMAMGREASGVVENQSGALAPGTAVFGSCAAGSGALAEYVLLDASQTARVPEGVSAEQAACLPVAACTAWDALHELQVEPGELVLVLGAGGGVGVHAVQLSTLLGARVVGVASEGKRSLVEELGATHVASGPGWTARVAEVVAAGEQRRNAVDAVIDSVGGAPLVEASRLLADAVRLRSAADPALAAEVGGSGIIRRRSAAVYAEVAELVRDGHLEPVIGQVLPFTEAGRAVEIVETGHAAGKVIVTFS